MDAERIKANFASLSGHGEDLTAYFYADLFERDPSLRALFPASMGGQHAKLLGALTHIVSLIDDTPALVPYLRELGHRHGQAEVMSDHYVVVGASLLATLAHFSGPDWNGDLEDDWAAVYGLVAQVMAEAAHEVRSTIRR
ncbi:globin domain-containing protein [Spirillospora sp. CA-294931]|uniref:globin domain-containing protein n=1 Tax=Spirillospora sp. CA-294931 TaxID=3240042 RepID=UPI003D92808D